MATGNISKMLHDRDVTKDHW